jgi:glycosyltransferase involved in cell wall biosynthesis
MLIKIPLFSIVIANYNHGDYLESAILSVLNQSCQDFELIIVDGGSTDNSLEIIKKYDQRLSWWVSEIDNGQSAAFNKGFRKAKGTFFFWLNADDLLLPNSLTHAKTAIQQNTNCLWFAANTIFFSKNGKIKKCSVGPTWNSFIIKYNIIYVYGPTSIFHRSLLEKAGGFDEILIYTMDADLWLRFYNMGESFIRINHFFWGFRVHDDSKTSHAFKNQANPRFAAERKYVLDKNKHVISRSSKYILFLFKFIAGYYLSSLYYTLKLSGKSILLFK